jgi:hypothetical protein
VDTIGINLKKMVELTIEQATAIANMLGTLPANQCYNELTILLQAISKAQEKTKPLVPTK